LSIASYGSLWLRSFLKTSGTKRRSPRAARPSRRRPQPTASTAMNLGPGKEVYESEEVAAQPINDRPDGRRFSARLYAAKAVRSDISSVITLNLVSLCGPNDVIMGMSAASRPRAIRMRPTRRALWRGSNVYQRPPM
jgi:hypothetical protein